MKTNTNTRKTSVSKTPTAQLIGILTKRGYTSRKADIEDSIQRNSGSQGNGTTTMVSNERKSGMQSIFDDINAHNIHLSELLNILESKARNLFGYDFDPTEQKGAEGGNARAAFNHASDVRAALLERLANVTNAYAEFIG